MRSVNGFTMLEILIAMAIFTMIGIGSTALLTTVIDSNEAASERFVRLQSLQRAMLLIERDVQQAIARPVRIEGEAIDRVMFGGITDTSDADGLAFVRAGWSNPQFMLPRSTLEYVAYRLTEGRLERLSGHYLDNVIGYEPKERVLLDDVLDFRVEFYVGGEEDGELRWSDSYVGTTLPQGVALIIESETFGTLRREFALVGANS
ncbi:type II secretion system protein GspJ [Alteromonas sediminis]|uniref:Type II secretion system protein J n=1 Tax=Alteromonas sediminis TaxID=2259342 RepID=A0A3N5YMM1_9ALTE|nr:type II secretion system minor pseudopilin GspJ [Alteromonas sediminis]RPJ66691.1 type II secretion system protein GspJ [Alteromonas sediminis]